MSKDIVGTLKKVVLDGRTFDVMADADADQKQGAFENEGQPTSGRTVKKMTVRLQSTDSIALFANASEAAILQALNDRASNFPMSYTNAAGDTYRAVGFINYEGLSSQTGTATIQMVPENNDGWALFEG